MCVCVCVVCVCVVCVCVVCVCVCCVCVCVTVCVCDFLIGGASLHFGPHNHSSAHDDMSCGSG